MWGEGRKNKIKNKINKTLVLTLGSPSEKGGEKKNPGISPGQVRRLHNEPAEKGQEKKTLILTLGRLSDLDFRTWSCPSVEVLSVRRGPETKICTWTDRQTSAVFRIPFF
jgi:hypothetical protein